jgi:hypothetical protein
MRQYQRDSIEPLKSLCCTLYIKWEYVKSVLKVLSRPLADSCRRQKPKVDFWLSGTLWSELPIFAYVSVHAWLIPTQALKLDWIDICFTDTIVLKF